MAITAETRNSIIELVVTAYNAPPGTTLLTELVAIVDGGGTLADVATALTTSDTWSGLYPSFQTAEEFAAEWLGNLVPEADADALAGGIDIAVGLINGGASFADIILVAQDFLANLAEDDAEFGSSAANFNNKVEVATYHTITLEQDADDIGDLQNVLANVTSDDDSVADAQNDAAAAVPGETVSLTTGLDTGAAFTTGSTNDIFSAVDTNDAETTTLTTGDSLVGGDGTDTLSLAISGAAEASVAVASASVENLKIYNNSTEDYEMDASLMDGLTDVFVNAGTSATNVTTDAIVNLHLLNTDQNASVDAGENVDGSADAAIILANGSDATATYNGLETINLVATGSDSDVTVVSDALETLNVSGEADVTVAVTFDGVDVDSKTATLDASAAGGDVDATVTGGVGGVTSVTMGAGDDTIDFRDAITAEVTISGGEGTDTLQLGALGVDGTDITFDAEAEASEAAGLNVSGIEALQLWNADVDGRALSGNAESSITALTAWGDAAVTYMPIASATHIFSGALTLGDAEAEVAGAGGDVTAFTLTQFGVAGNVATTLTADEVETLTVVSAGEDASYTNTVTMSEDGSASLTTVVAAGPNGLTLNIGGELLETVNAAGLTGADTFTLTADGGADVTVTGSSVRPDDTEVGTANNITTGEGDDTITTGDYNDIIAAAGGDNSIMAGAGDDNITAGEGADTIMGGAGDDTINAGEGMNVLSGEAGDDNITTGRDDSTVTGGAGDDTIVAGKGDDVLTGGDGDDVITTGRGSDTVDAGDDDDIIYTEDLDSEDVIDGGEGEDTVSANSIDAEATYAADADFVTVDGDENVEVNLPGVETLYITRDDDDSSDSVEVSLDFAGAPDLDTLYLNLDGDDEGASEGGGFAISNVAASTINLQFLSELFEDSEGTMTISGDGQAVTINQYVNGEETSTEGNISFKDFGNVTYNILANDIDSEAEHTGFSVEGAMVFDDIANITITAASSGLDAEDDNAIEAGFTNETGEVTVEGDTTESLTFTVGSGTQLDVASVNIGAEVEDGLAISLNVNDDAIMTVYQFVTTGLQDAAVEISIGDSGSLSFGNESEGSGLDFGAEASVSIAMERASDVEFNNSIEYEGSLSITATAFGVEISGMDTSLTLGNVDIDISGRGAIEGGLTDLVGSGDSFGIDLSGWQDDTGAFAAVVPAANTATDITIVDNSDANNFTSITHTESAGAAGAGESASFSYTGGEAEVTVTLGASDDTIITGGGEDTIITGDGENTVSAGNGVNNITGGAGDDIITAGEGNDVIDGGAGNDVITAGGGDNSITLTGGSSAEDYDTIVSLNTEAAAGENDTIVLGDQVAQDGASAAYTGAVTILGTVLAAEDLDVASAAEAEDSVDAGDVIATVTGGMLTLVADTEAGGTAEDLAAFDTLDEYLAAALIALNAGDANDSEAVAGDIDELTVGFVLGGSTYIVSTADDATADDAALAIDDVIKLTGLDAETTYSLGTAAAGDTIVVG